MQYHLSNGYIDLACEDVGKFLVSAGVERREALRIKLTFEEVLLEYQSKFGETADFKVRTVKRFSSIKVQMMIPGGPLDPLGKSGEEDAVIRGLLAGIGLVPSWSYRNGRNYVVFIPRKKALSDTAKMVGAIGLAVVSGIILNLLPGGFRTGVTDYVLNPVMNTFMGLISAISGPLIFLSVLASICSMGNMETLGKVGSKSIKVILLYMTAIGAFMSVFGSLFYRIEMGSSDVAGYSQILDLIYNIIPSNLFEPFITGNALQLIISTVCG